MKTRVFGTTVAVMMALAGLSIAASSITVGSLSNLDVTVASYRAVTNYPVYCGDGPVISYTPLPGPFGGGGGMSSVFIDNTGTYVVTELSSKPGLQFVVVECELTNATKEYHEFTIRDFSIVPDVGTATLTAVGLGKYAFAKNPDDMNTAIHKPIAVKPSEIQQLVLVYSVSDKGKSIKITCGSAKGATLKLYSGK